MTMRIIPTGANAKWRNLFAVEGLTSMEIVVAVEYGYFQILFRIYHEYFMQCRFIYRSYKLH
jgi:hypothetical protein